MRLYYIIMKRGVPVDVTSWPWTADRLAKELSTSDAEATIVPVTPTQLEFEEQWLREEKAVKGNDE